jgi:lipopolysaccharide/colanic/teichoic acid biosynthesis glycosyltransferase
MVDPLFISQYYEIRKSPNYLQARNSSILPKKLRRAIDVIGSASALFFLAPLLGAVALAIKLTSKGPAIFSTQRVGLGGQSFSLYKFRTMYADPGKAVLAAESYATYKIKNDPRITPVGRFLRRTSLDELPQFWNVLKGDMTLVGPRPLSEWELRVLVSELYQRQMRLHLRPGITGIWMVERDKFPLLKELNEKFEDAVVVREQAMLLKYLAKRSLGVDVEILGLSLVRWLYKMIFLSVTPSKQEFES